MVVITYNRKFVRLSELGAPNYDDEPYIIKNEGVYMFGGVTGMTVNEKNLSNKLYFLPLGENVRQRWRELKTQGQPPEGRFHHSM